MAKVKETTNILISASNTFEVHGNKEMCVTKVTFVCQVVYFESYANIRRHNTYMVILLFK